MNISVAEYLYLQFEIAEKAMASIIEEDSSTFEIVDVLAASMRCLRQGGGLSERPTEL